MQDSEQKDYINVKGCVPQFEKWLQDNLTLVAGIFIGVALLQASSIRYSSRCFRENLRQNHFIINIWSCFFHPQIFGICLAQNLVSDIEAVRASWWENDLHHYCTFLQTVVCFQSHLPWFSSIFIVSISQKVLCHSINAVTSTHTLTVHYIDMCTKLFTSAMNSTLQSHPTYTKEGAKSLQLYIILYLSYLWHFQLKLSNELMIVPNKVAPEHTCTGI